MKEYSLIFSPLASYGLTIVDDSKSKIDNFVFGVLKDVVIEY